MRILITNDDGVHAKGISVLKKIASVLSDDIWICAPETEQSASSRSVSLHNPVRIKQYGEKTFSNGNSCWHSYYYGHSKT